MAVNQDTLWDRFLSPIIGSLIDFDKLQQLDDTMDWEAECVRVAARIEHRFRNPDLIYPDYYSTQNFHGIEGGYLNGSAATSYDPITQYALPPNETWVLDTPRRSKNGDS